jgi:hypothetical protein
VALILITRYAQVNNVVPHHLGVPAHKGLIVLGVKIVMDIKDVIMEDMTELDSL